MSINTNLIQKEGIMNRKPYPTDLTQEQFKKIDETIPYPAPRGRPCKWPVIEIINAILYVIRSGCAWRLLPHDFPPWQTVYYRFNKWKKDGTWEKVHNVLVKKVRISEGRDPDPSAAIIDSQSVKTTEQGGSRGYDAGKKVNGRKRHIIVDTIGLIIGVTVHSANIQDRDGAKMLLSKLTDNLPRLQLIWADGGYSGKLVEWVKEKCKWILEIVKRPEDMSGFQVLPRRWVVERTFGWLGRHRRLSKDYERQTDTSEAVIRIAMIAMMVRRL